MLIMSQADFDASSNLFIDKPSNLQKGLKYKYLKRHYDRSDYSKLDDPAYGMGRPWLNLILPGLAQYTMGEPGLGTKYLLTSCVIPVTLMSTGYVLAFAGAIADEQNAAGGEDVLALGGGLLVIGSVMCVVGEIASI